MKVMSMKTKELNEEASKAKKKVVQRNQYFTTLKYHKNRTVYFIIDIGRNCTNKAILS